MIGRTVSHYNIVSQLGSGGMGVVYKADDPRLGRAVALKFLPDDYAKNRQAMERFEREARAASSLHHPHICTIFDIGEHQGRPFIVMELLDGEDIRDRVARRPLQPDEFLEVAIQLADALDATHASGIVHRDIKPANIMISSRGHATLLDFGLAKLAADRPGSTGADELTLTGDPQLTNPGSTVGTIASMSPEQVSGEELDGRSDLFSFGAVLYEMIAGRPAFNGNTSGLLFDAVLNRVPVPIAQLNPKIPAGIPLVIDRALEKDRNVRYQTAADLRADLKRVRRDSSSMHALPVQPTPLQVTPQPPPPRTAEISTGYTQTPPPAGGSAPHPGYPPTPPGAGAQGKEWNMPRHIKVNGWLMIVMGGFTILGGLLGAIIGRLAQITELPVFFLVQSVSVFSIAVGAVMVWAGRGLLRYNNRARIVTLIVAVVLLSMFPFGTAMGIYAGWALLTKEGRAYFGK